VNIPSNSVHNGRDIQGRFGPGNRLAHGNPHSKAVAQFRAAIYESVTVDQIRQVVQMLVTKALAGDVLAARELLNRCIGKAINATPEQIQAIQINVGLAEPRKVIKAASR